jgi:amino acid adenylation domain-containing protein
MKINFIEYWQETVSKYPSKIILTEGDRQVTVAELDTYARNICKAIEGKCQKINVPIAVYLNKSISGIAANIAILYSGNFFFNVDIKSPDERNQKILKLIDPALIISDSENSSKFFLDNEILQLDSILTRDSEYTPTSYLNQIDVDPMCIINTSGSTGMPKSVVLNHRNFIDFFNWSLGEFRFDSLDVIGSLSPAIFDIYVFELMLVMGVGARMVIIPEESIPFPVRMLEVLEREGVTFIFWVPTIMVNISNLKLLEKHALNSLRLVWFAGEVFPTKPFNYWFDTLRDAVFVNLYGPIEITLDCTFYVVKNRVPDDEPIPIGLACRNTNVLVLNEMLVSVESGEVGELCIRGTSLAMGYYNNPEMTAMKFIQNPLNKSYPELIYRTGDLVTVDKDGNIHYKGRNDTMVKHSGYRIELAEIEHAAMNKPQLVRNCCVLYDVVKKQIIMAYENDEELEVSKLRERLSFALPKYMIPTKFVYFKKMPMNTNGKIDRMMIKNEISLGEKK